MSREPVVGGTPFFHIFPVDQNGWKIHEFTKPAIYISTLWKYGPDACDQVVVMAITGRCVSSSFPNESNGLRMRPWLFVFFWTPLLYKLETRFWILCGVFSRMSHDRFILAYDTCNDKHCFTFTGFIDVVDDIVQGALWQPFGKNLCFTHPQGETPKPWDWDPFLKYPHVFWDFTTWWYSRIWSD